jgi:hypothetical protein
VRRDENLSGAIKTKEGRMQIANKGVVKQLLSRAAAVSVRARSIAAADNGRAPLPMLLLLTQHLSCSRSLSCHLTANRRTDFFALVRAQSEFG